MRHIIPRKNWKRLPIAFASLTLNRAGKSYETREKELLAIVWATKNFRPYLYNRKLKIDSDHKPLAWVTNVKDPGSRLFRWRIHLEEYDYESGYKKRSLNTNADALSWINIVCGQRDTKTVVSDEETKKQVLYEYHDAHIGRHKGINPLNPELNPICYLLALLGAHHFLHVSRIRVKLLTFRRLMSCI